VGAWTVDKESYANGNVLLWNALLPYKKPGGLISDNMGIAWHSGYYGPEVIAHVEGAWKIYEHSADIAFLRRAYDFYKSMFWDKIPRHWGFEFSGAECLAKMAKELCYSSDPNHWYRLINMDKIDNWLKAKWQVDTPHLFGSGSRKLDWSNMAFMSMDRFPDDWAWEMTQYWAVNDKQGYFGQVPLLTVALKDWEKISKVFAVTPDTNSAVCIYITSVKTQIFVVWDISRATILSGAFPLHLKAGTSISTLGVMSILTLTLGKYYSYWKE
jgi:hypothetical protein